MPIAHQTNEIDAEIEWNKTKNKLNNKKKNHHVFSLKTNVFARIQNRPAISVANLYEMGKIVIFHDELKFQRLTLAFVQYIKGPHKSM